MCGQVSIGLISMCVAGCPGLGRGELTVLTEMVLTTLVAPLGGGADRLALPEPVQLLSRPA